MEFILDNFNVFSDSEFSLTKLEKIILNLAVKGKLTKQEANDEPASVLLEKIKGEKDKVIKKEKALTPINEDEIPFKIPDSWEWVRLGELVNFVFGKTPSRKNEKYWNNPEYNWISIGDMESGNYLIKTNEMISRNAYEKIFNGKISKKGSLLMSFKLSIGKMVILDIDSFHNEAIATLEFYYDYKEIIKKYLFKCLNGFDLLKNSSNAIKGKTLNKESLNNILIALPPLSEQQRIVERINDLRKQIDLLRNKIIKKEKLRIELKKSIFQEIENSNSNDILLENLDKMFQNFDIIIREKEDVKDIRDLILSIAVKGKLTKQEANDEPASVLLEKIKGEKDKVIKKEKALTPINEDEIPFKIPDSWEWVRLGELVNFVFGKTPSRKNEKYWNNPEYNWISIGDMESGNYLIKTNEMISRNAYEKIFNGKISKKGSLLMSFKLSIGKMVILDIDSFHNEAIATLEFYYDYKEIIKKYLFKCLNGFDLLKNSSNAIKGKTLNKESLNNILIALPPLSEQQRIVERIEKLRNLCDKIEEKMGKKEILSRNILQWNN